MYRDVDNLIKNYDDLIKNYDDLIKKFDGTGDTEWEREVNEVMKYSAMFDSELLKEIRCFYIKYPNFRKLMGKNAFYNEICTNVIENRKFNKIQNILETSFKNAVTHFFKKEGLDEYLPIVNEYKRFETEQDYYEYVLNTVKRYCR